MTETNPAKGYEELRKQGRAKLKADADKIREGLETKSEPQKAAEKAAETGNKAQGAK